MRFPIESAFVVVLVTLIWAYVGTSIYAQNPPGTVLPVFILAWVTFGAGWHTKVVTDWLRGGRDGEA